MFQRNDHQGPVAAARRARSPWRLLVECSDDAARISDFTAFRDAGFQIMLCEGPVDDARECPVVRGGICPFVADADVVLFDGDRPFRSEVLAGVRASRPGLPIVVLSAHVGRSLERELLGAGVAAVLRKGGSVTELIATVDRLVAPPA